MYYVKLARNGSTRYNTKWEMNIRRNILGFAKLCRNGFHYYSGASLRAALLKAYLWDNDHGCYLGTSDTNIFRCLPYGSTEYSFSKSCSVELTTLEELKMPCFTLRELKVLACLIIMDNIDKLSINKKEQCKVRTRLNKFINKNVDICGLMRELDFLNDVRVLYIFTYAMNLDLSKYKQRQEIKSFLTYALEKFYGSTGEPKFAELVEKAKELK